MRVVTDNEFVNQNIVKLACSMQFLASSKRGFTLSFRDFANWTMIYLYYGIGIGCVRTRRLSTAPLRST